MHHNSQFSERFLFVSVRKMINKQHFYDFAFTSDTHAFTHCVCNTFIATILRFLLLLILYLGSLAYWMCIVCFCHVMYSKIVQGNWHIRSHVQWSCVSVYENRTNDIIYRSCGRSVFCASFPSVRYAVASEPSILLHFYLSPSWWKLAFAISTDFVSLFFRYSTVKTHK